MATYTLVTLATLATLLIPAIATNASPTKLTPRPLAGGNFVFDWWPLRSQPLKRKSALLDIKKIHCEICQILVVDFLDNLEQSLATSSTKRGSVDLVVAELLENDKVCDLNRWEGYATQLGYGADQLQKGCRFITEELPDTLDSNLAKYRSNEAEARLYICGPKWGPCEGQDNLWSSAQHIRARPDVGQFNTEVEAEFLTWLDANPEIKRTENGIRYKIVGQVDITDYGYSKTGSENDPEDLLRRPPETDDLVTAHYHGTLPSGATFDSSFERDDPLVFHPRDVIPGWREGLQQMTPGQEAILVVPAKHGYGPSGSGRVGPNQTLIFAVRLLSVRREARVPATPHHDADDDADSDYEDDQDDDLDEFDAPPDLAYPATDGSRAEL